MEKETIRHLIGLLQNAPNGGNKLQVEYALVDDVEQMDRPRTLASERMDALAACGIYPDGYDEKAFRISSGPKRPYDRICCFAALPTC